MPYQYFVVAEHMRTVAGVPLRTALFQRMHQEGLLPFTMHAYAKPQLQHWLESTHPQRGWLLCCTKSSHFTKAPTLTRFTQKSQATTSSHAMYAKDATITMDAAHIQAMAFLAPLAWGQGNKGHRVWTFDFTVFRPFFAEAVAMSRQALPWIFTHAPCDTLLGLCAKSNKHAWRLAQSAGFQVLGHIPGACFMGKKGAGHEAGVLVMATRGDSEV